MWKSILYVLLAFSGIAFAGNGREATAVPASDTLRIDGVLDEPAWKNAPENSAFLRLGARTPEPEPTSFRVLNTPRGIVFGITVKDSAVQARKRNADEGVWNDDCVEVLLAPVEKFSSDPNVREFYHFIVNAENSRYDAFSRGGVADAGRNFRWMSATRRTADGWTAEIMLPFYNFEFSGNGIPAVWQCNVIRENKTAAGNAVSAWSPTPAPNVCENFGTLSGIAADAKFFRAEANKIELVRAGDAIRLNVEIDAAPGRALEAVAVIRRDGKLFALRRTAVRADNKGRAAGSIALPEMESGPCELEMLLIDPDGRTVWYEARPLQADFSPVALRVARPLYRNTLYASNPHPEIELAFAFRGASAPPSDLSWKITVADASGRELYRTETRAAAVVIPVGADWPCGKLVCRIRASAGGEAEAVIQRVPRAPGCEVVVDAAGRLTVDGKPFFARGFMGVGIATDLAGLAAAGCNTVHSYSLHRTDLAEIRARLDACEKAGLKIIMMPFAGSSVGFWGVNRDRKTLPRFTEAQLAQMRKLVETLRDHPALLGWYLFDEPRGAEWCDELKRVYGMLREIDPYHPVFGCDNSPGGCLALIDHCDVLLLDIYLNPFAGGEPARSVEMVTAACRKLGEAVRGTGKGFWFVPQAFDADSFAKPDAPRERRAPTVAESRASVWGAVAVGARGILAYKIGNPAVVQPGVRHINAGIYASEELRTAFLDSIMPELARREDFLLNEVAVPGVSPLLAAQGTEQRQPLVLVVNPTTEKQWFRKTTAMKPYEVGFFSENLHGTRKQ